MCRETKTIRVVIEVSISGTYGNPQPDLEAFTQRLLEHCSQEGAVPVIQHAEREDFAIARWTVQPCSLQPARMD